MATPLPPQGGLSDDQLLAAPGPTDEQLLAAPGPSDDALLSAPGPSANAPAHGPGLLSRIGGIVGRGVLGGLTGLASAVGNPAPIAVGGALPSSPGDGNAGYGGLNDADVRSSLPQKGEDAADQVGVYRPSSLGGKLVQGTISGATAGLLDPLAAATRVPGLVTGAASSLIGGGAQAEGATDGEAAAAALAGGLIVPGSIAGARAAVGSTARNWAAGRAAANMTDDGAVHTVLLNNALKQYQDAAIGPPPSSFQAAGAYKKDLNGVLSQYGRTGVKAGVLDPTTAMDLAVARSTADAHTNALAGVPGGSYDSLQAPGAIPDGHLPVVNAALGQLDRVSTQQFKNASAGPFASLAQKLVPAASWGSALAGLAHGNAGPVLDAAAGGVVGKVAGAVLPTVGRSLDHLVGTAVTPAESTYAGALRRVQDNGLTVPDAPLLAMRAATNSFSDPQALFEATNGLHGSPADPLDPRMEGPQPGSAQTPAGAPLQTGGTGSPVTPGPSAAPATHAVHLDPSIAGPVPSDVAPLGGQTLASQQHARYFPGQAAPTTEHLNQSANAVLDPQKAYEFSAGLRMDPNDTYKVALHAGRQQASSAPAQASAEVSSLMGGASGGDRGPIANLPRWQAAGANYQRHAANMMALASAPAEKQAISQIAAIPDTAGKQAIKDVYQANNPEADLTRFTPQLMKGI